MSYLLRNKIINAPCNFILFKTTTIIQMYETHRLKLTYTNLFMYVSNSKSLNKLKHKRVGR